jgi:hypothetical protein
MAKTIFYAPVSTKDQRLDLQLDAARKIGVATKNIFVEKASGIRHDRPMLEKALAALEKVDTPAAYKLDRIGRSLVHVTKLLAELEQRGVHFRTVEDGLSTQGSTGKLQRQLLRQHDVPGDQIADRREAPAALPPAHLVELVDIQGGAKPNAIAPPGGSADHLERPLLRQLPALRWC